MAVAAPHSRVSTPSLCIRSAWYRASQSVSFATFPAVVAAPRHTIQFGTPRLAHLIIALVLMRSSHRAVPKWRGGGRPQPSPGVRVLVKEVQAPQFKRQARAAAIHGREVREPPRAARADDDAARLMHKAARSLRRAEVETEARRRARACAKTSRASYSHFGQRRGGWRWPRRPWCRRRRRSRL